jgi:hypothetical protein
MRRYFFLLVIIFSVGLAPTMADAATITAVTSGSWVTPGTWDCNCLPAKSDNIIIPHGITVSVTRPISLAPGNDIIITIAGSLDLTNGLLQLDEADWITIIPGGRIFANGMGGTIYSGITQIVMETGSFISGPATITRANPVKIEKQGIGASDARNQPRTPGS